MTNNWPIIRKTWTILWVFDAQEIVKEDKKTFEIGCRNGLEKLLILTQTKLLAF